MPPSEAQKRASNKYNLEHNATLGCKVLHVIPLNGMWIERKKIE